MRYSVLLATVGLSALLGSGSGWAVDYRLLPVADGSQDRFYGSGDATSSRLNCEYSEGSSSQGRRVVLKFDISGLSAYQLRGARLNLFGGRNSAAGVMDVRAYRYSFNTWNDASNGAVPFAADANCTYLASKLISNLLSADYIGTSQWHEFDLGAQLGGWSGDGFLSIALRNFNTVFGASVSFVSRNSVPWDGSKGKEPYIVFRTYDPNASVQSGTFAGGDVSDWIIISGGGTAAAVANPHAEGDSLIELKSGSPVTLAQDLDTPAVPFYVVFAHEFRTATGSLEVTLKDRNGNSTLLGTATEPASVAEALTTTGLRVEAPELLGLDQARLSFTLDGPAGSLLWLDDIAFSDTAPVGGPVLRIELLGGGQVLLAWPDASVGFVLQENPGVTPAGWSAVGVVPDVVGEERQVILEANQSERCYRLVKP